MTTRKPAWKLLPVIVVLMGALLAVIERAALPPAIRTALQIAVTAGGFGAIGLWVRCNRIAIALAEWREMNEPGRHGSLAAARTPDRLGRLSRGRRGEVIPSEAARSEALARSQASGW
jgi:hypothetical protein